MGGLSNITVLDFSKLMPGPFCTLQLADLGCRVIRIELPYWPDMAREIGPRIEGQGFIYAMCNRNKESLALDYRKPEGKKALLKLIAQADVLVEGFRPGLMERIGLGHKNLLKKFPRLIYCSLTGFGQDGPMSRRAGHDINFLAESGFIGAGDSNGGLSFPATQVADLCGSQAAANAILAALLARGSEGRGRHIDISMTEAVYSWMVLPLGYSRATGKPYNKDGSHWWAGCKAFYRLYQTKDARFLSVAALERPFAEALLRELGRSDLISEVSRMGGQGDQTRLIRALEREFKSKTLRQWETRLSKKDVCVTPVRTIEEARRIYGSPLVRRKPPQLGADNEAVLRSFKIPQKEIRRLKASGLLKKD